MTYTHTYSKHTFPRSGRCACVVFLMLWIACCATSVHAQSRAYKIYKYIQGGAKLYQAATLTDEEMQDYARQSIAVLDSRNNVCSSSSSYCKRLAKITKDMKKIKGVALNFKVYKSDEVNAFASPDGSIRVYSHLMDIMTDDEVLAVIGHELGHLAHHDSKSEYQSALVASAIRDGLMTRDGRIGELARSTLGSVGEALVNAKYSRKQEAAADNYGYSYIRHHGINPWAIVTAFEKMKALHDKRGNSSGGINKMFSSHPGIEERIKAMTDRAKQDGFKRP